MPSGCFNGATTSRSWNVLAPHRPGLRRRSGFNGATTSRSWNAAIGVWIEQTLPALQWSHDLSVVECLPARAPPTPERIGFNGATTSRSWNGNVRQICGECLTNVCASMEPRPLGRGMLMLLVQLDGAAFASMEPRPLGRGMSGTWRPRRSATGFNGATTSRSWNVDPGRPRTVPEVDGFNGATTSRSWNVHANVENVGRASRFNGATTSRSWNAVRRPRRAPAHTPLQWSHDLSVVEWSMRPRRIRSG